MSVGESAVIVAEKPRVTVPAIIVVRVRGFRVCRVNGLRIVHGRTGHLETTAWEEWQDVSVLGRTGHLEMRKSIKIVKLTVHGRTGHLEIKYLPYRLVLLVHGRTGHLEIIHCI